jgi:hypothetical protein
VNRYTLPLAAVAVALVWVLAGCGGSAAAPAAQHSAPAPLSLLQVCRQLRSDMLANGGQPDQPTADRLSTALLGRGQSGLPYDLGALDSDMREAGTQGRVDAALDLGDVAADCQGQHVTLPQG